MPYIKQSNRKPIDVYLDQLIAWMPEISDKTVGDYTYVIYKIMLKAIYSKNFYKYALVFGAIESAKFEIMRRGYTKYEISKLNENGDI